MTQEEKARAYDEALERAREVIKNNPDFVRVTPKLMEEIFPELAESEDERIRKKLITYFQDLKGGWFGDISHDNIIAWLEKQSKKKNEVEKGGELRMWGNFEKTHEGTTITIPKDLKGTDTDGGVVGEMGEQGEQGGQPSEEELVGIGELGKVWNEQAIISRLDKIISLLESAILVIPKETRVPPIMFNDPLIMSPDPNTLGGWKTWASTCTTTDDKNIKIQEDETSKPKS